MLSGHRSFSVRGKRVCRTGYHLRLYFLKQRHPKSKTPIMFLRVLNINSSNLSSPLSSHWIKPSKKLTRISRLRSWATSRSWTMLTTSTTTMCRTSRISLFRLPRCLKLPLSQKKECRSVKQHVKWISTPRSSREKPGSKSHRNALKKGWELPGFLENAVAMGSSRRMWKELGC